MNFTYKELWQARDRFAVNTADVIYPVSARSGGKLAAILKDENIQKRVLIHKKGRIWSRVWWLRVLKLKVLF